MRKGAMVKIPDIGPLGKVLEVSEQEVKVELEGEQFWISRELVEVMR